MLGTVILVPLPFPMRHAPKQAVGIAILVGVKKLDSVHFCNFQSTLTSTGKDVEDFEMITKLAGMNVQTILDENATKPKLTSAINKASNSLKEGDFLLLVFAGFGGLVSNFDGNLGNSHSPTWCLYNCQLLLTELFQALSQLAEGVNVLVVSDASSAAPHWKLGTKSGITKIPRNRTLPIEVAESVYLKNKDFYDAIHLSIDSSAQIVANLVWLSACQLNQAAFEKDNNGFLTAAIKHVWNGGAFNGNFERFLDEVTMALPPKQSPNIKTYGISPDKIMKRKPFVI